MSIIQRTMLSEERIMHIIRAIMSIGGVIMVIVEGIMFIVRAIMLIIGTIMVIVEGIMDIIRRKILSIGTKKQLFATDGVTAGTPHLKSPRWLTRAFTF